MSFQDLEAGRPLPSRRGAGNGSQNPTQAVAAGIFQINISVTTFKRLVNIIGTAKDTPEHRDKLHKTRQHIGQLVKETSSKLKAASETDQHLEVSASKKIADAKLAKDFQTVLKEFQKAQQLAAERETAYAPFVPHAALPSSYTASELNLGPDINQEHQALLIEQRRQEVLMLENEVVFNEAIIEEREQGIKEIQEQIEEVNEIFKDLAVLVHEQGVIIDDIDSNIESSYSATAQAKTQLDKASKDLLITGNFWCGTAHCDHSTCRIASHILHDDLQIINPQSYNLEFMQVNVSIDWQAGPLNHLDFYAMQRISLFIKSCGTGHEHFIHFMLRT